MPGSRCGVKNCPSTSHDSYGNHRNNGIQFFRLPKWTQHQGEQVSDLTRRRRIAWLAAIRRKDLTFDLTPQSMRVCSLHFHSGTFSKKMSVLLSLKGTLCKVYSHLTVKLYLAFKQIVHSSASLFQMQLAAYTVAVMYQKAMT